MRRKSLIIINIILVVMILIAIFANISGLNKEYKQQYFEKAEALAQEVHDGRSW